MKFNVKSSVQFYFMDKNLEWKFLKNFDHTQDENIVTLEI